MCLARVYKLIISFYVQLFKISFFFLIFLTFSKEKKYINMLLTKKNSTKS